jgi:hypothetical protein
VADRNLSPTVKSSRYFGVLGVFIGSLVRRRA